MNRMSAGNKDNQTCLRTYMNDYKKKKRKNRRHTILTIFVCSILIIMMILFLALLILQMNRDSSSEEKPTELTPQQFISTLQQELLEKDGSGQPQTEEAETVPATEALTEAATDESDQGPSGEPGTRKALSDLTETDIYAFMQGPKAWESKVPFSGSWCSEVLYDQEFSVFGCGLCALASIYSTLTPCDCSPLDMFWYAKEVSGYAPSSGYGAIDWPYMRQTLKSVGISSRQRRKPQLYEQFQTDVAESLCTIALISSYEDDTYWHNVEGHYVTLWLYDSKDDTILLSDSGNPDHNLQRIPLRYIYDALKKVSRRQYMIITDVDENGNTWGHDGIDIRWRKPRYYKTMGLY